MKKLFAVALAVMMVLSFCACGKSNTNGKTTAPDTTDLQNTQTSQSAQLEPAKTGYAVISEIKDDEYSPSDTLLEINSVCAAVITDMNDRVIELKIDEAQIKPDLEKNNGNVSDLRTKLEKKDDYGMKAASKIQKEWYEQAVAFGEWAKGKTADEIASGVDENGSPTATDLKSSCTINVSAFVKASVAAIENAGKRGASATDKLAFDIDAEKYPTDENKSIQYDICYSVVTLDEEGRITSCIIDSSQAKCTVANGKFTVEKGTYQTKKELGDAYGMKSASAIKKEWYEQAQAIEEWAIGKTASEIADTYDKDNKTTDKDLASGCTMSVSSIIDCLASAAEKQ